MKKLFQAQFFRGLVCLFLLANQVTVGILPVEAAEIPLTVMSGRIPIPALLGRETDYFQGLGKTFVIHIQDAHSNPSAQKNIARLLAWIAKQNPDEAPLITLEGLQGSMHPEYLEFFPHHPKVNQWLVSHLVNQGELTGAELYAWKTQKRQVTSDKKQGEEPVFVGVENAALYRENLAIYKEFLDHETEIKKVLDVMRGELYRRENNTLSKEAREYLREKRRRKEGNYQTQFETPQWEVYLKYLKQALKVKVQLDLEEPFEQIRFPNVVRLDVLMRAFKDLDVREGQKQKEEFVTALGRKLRTPQDQETLRAFRGRTFNRNLRELAERVWALQLSYQVDPKHFGMFWRMMGRNILESELDIAGLNAEFHQLEDWLEAVLAEKDDAKKVFQLGHEFARLEKMLSLEMSSEELEVEGWKSEVISVPPALKPWVKKSEKFYKLARKRDRALLENTLKAAEGKKTVVLITGGFHTKGLKARMRARGIGYAVLQPNMKFAGEDLYRKVLRGENADVSAYFDSLNLNRQEAVFFKSIVEKGASALWEKEQVPHARIARTTAEALRTHPVLKNRFQPTAFAEGKQGSRLDVEERPLTQGAQAVVAALLTNSALSFDDLYTGREAAEVRRAGAEQFSQISVSAPVKITYRPLGTVMQVHPKTRSVETAARSKIRSEVRSLLVEDSDEARRKAALPKVQRLTQEGYEAFAIDRKELVPTPGIAGLMGAQTYAQAIEGQEKIEALARANGYQSWLVSDFFLLTYELILNMLQYAAGGAFGIKKIEEGGQVYLEAVFWDSGTGIADPEQSRIASTRSYQHGIGFQRLNEVFGTVTVEAHGKRWKKSGPNESFRLMAEESGINTQGTRMTVRVAVSDLLKRSEVRSRPTGEPGRVYFPPENAEVRTAKAAVDGGQWKDPSGLRNSLNSLHKYPAEAAVVFLNSVRQAIERKELSFEAMNVIDEISLKDFLSRFPRKKQTEELRTAFDELKKAVYPEHFDALIFERFGASFEHLGALIAHRYQMKYLGVPIIDATAPFARAMMAHPFLEAAADFIHGYTETLTLDSFPQTLTSDIEGLYALYFSFSVGSFMEVSINEFKARQILMIAERFIEKLNKKHRNHSPAGGKTEAEPESISTSVTGISTQAGRSEVRADLGHHYTRATDEEKDKVLAEIKSLTPQAVVDYGVRFINGVKRSGTRLDIGFPSEEIFRRAEAERVRAGGYDLTPERVYHEGLLKDEQGIYWIVKKKVPLTGVGRQTKNHSERERLAYLLAKGRANLTEIRLIADDEAKSVGLPGSFQEYYLSRVVTSENYSRFNLPHTRRDQAYAGLWVANILMRKYDPHLLNIGSVNGVPVALDHDGILFAEFYANEIEYGFERFVKDFFMHTVIRTAMHMKPSDPSELFWDDLRIIREMSLQEGSYRGVLQVIQNMATDLALGDGYIKAEGLTPENIRQSILDFKNIQNVRELAEQAGYKAEELETVTRFIEENQKRLGQDVDFVWEHLTGRSGRFKDLDSLAGRSEVRAAGRRKLSEDAVPPAGDSWLTEPERTDWSRRSPSQIRFLLQLWSQSSGLSLDELVALPEAEAARLFTETVIADLSAKTPYTLEKLYRYYETLKAEKGSALSTLEFLLNQNKIRYQGQEQAAERLELEKYIGVSDRRSFDQIAEELNLDVWMHLFNTDQGQAALFYLLAKRHPEFKSETLLAMISEKFLDYEKQEEKPFTRETLMGPEMEKALTQYWAGLEPDRLQAKELEEIRDVLFRQILIRIYNPLLSAALQLPADDSARTVAEKALDLAAVWFRERLSDAERPVPDHLRQVYERIQSEYAAMRSENYQRHVHFKNGNGSARGIPSSELLLHQIAGVYFARNQNNGRVILGDEMGVGKTLQALITAEDARAEKIVIIAPNTLLANWDKEIKKWIGPETAVEVIGKKGGDRVKRLQTAVQSGVRFVLVSQEALGGAAMGPRLVDTLNGWKPDFIIGDEIHRLRNVRSKRSRQFARLDKSAASAVYLSGTTVVNGAADLFVALNAVDPVRFNDFEEFVKAIADDPVAMAQLNIELNQKYFLRRTLEQVMGNLPQKHAMEVIPVALDDAQKKALQDEEARYENRESARGSWDHFERQKQILIDLELLKELELEHKDPPKYRAAVEKVKAITASGERVVVFSRYRKVIHRLTAILEAELGEGSVAFMDSALHKTSESRDDVIARFNKSTTQKVFLTTMDMGGEGYTLKANHVLFTDLPYTSARLNQMIGRVYRYGQDKEVRVYALQVPDTMDEDILQILKHKENLFAQIIRGKINVELVRGSIRQLEEREARRVKRKTRAQAVRMWLADIYARLNEGKNEEAQELWDEGMKLYADAINDVAATPVTEALYAYLLQLQQAGTVDLSRGAGGREEPRWAFLASGPSVDMRVLKRMEKLFLKNGIPIRHFDYTEVDTSEAARHLGRAWQMEQQFPARTAAQWDLDLYESALPRNYFDFIASSELVKAAPRVLNAQGVAVRNWAVAQAVQAAAEGGLILIWDHNGVFTDKAKAFLSNPDTFNLEILNDKVNLAQIPGLDETTRQMVESATFILARKKTHKVFSIEELQKLPSDGLELQRPKRPTSQLSRKKKPGEADFEREKTARPGVTDLIEEGRAFVDLTDRKMSTKKTTAADQDLRRLRKEFYRLLGLDLNAQVTAQLHDTLRQILAKKPTTDYLETLLEKIRFTQTHHNRDYSDLLTQMQPFLQIEAAPVEAAKKRARGRPPTKTESPTDQDQSALVSVRIVRDGDVLQRFLDRGFTFRKSPEPLLAGVSVDGKTIWVDAELMNQQKFSVKERRILLQTLMLMHGDALFEPELATAAIFHYMIGVRESFNDEFLRLLERLDPVKTNLFLFYLESRKLPTAEDFLGASPTLREYDADKTIRILESVFGFLLRHRSSSRAVPEVPAAEQLQRVFENQSKILETAWPERLLETGPSIAETIPEAVDESNPQLYPLTEWLRQHKFQSSMSSQQLAARLRAIILPSEKERAEISRRLDHVIPGISVLGHMLDAEASGRAFVLQVIAAIAPDYYQQVEEKDAFDSAAFQQAMEQEAAIFEFTQNNMADYDWDSDAGIDVGQPFAEKLGMDTARLSAAISRQLPKQRINGEILSRLFDDFMDGDGRGMRHAIPWGELEIVRPKGTGHREPNRGSYDIGQARIWLTARGFNMTLAFSRAMQELGIEDLVDFSRVSAEDLDHFEGVGETTLRNLRAILAEGNVYLRGEAPSKAPESKENLFRPATVSSGRRIDQYPWSERVKKLMLKLPKALHRPLVTLEDLSQISAAEILNEGVGTSYDLRHLRREMEPLGIALRGELPIANASMSKEALSSLALQWLHRPLGEAPWSTRILKAFSGFATDKTTFADLTVMTADQLLSMRERNFGLTSLEEVRERLAVRGLALKGETVAAPMSPPTRSTDNPVDMTIDAGVLLGDLEWSEDARTFLFDELKLNSIADLSRMSAAAIIQAAGGPKRGLPLLQEFRRVLGQHEFALQGETPYVFQTGAVSDPAQIARTLKLKLSEIGYLNVRARKVLSSLGLETVQDLTQKRKEEILEQSQATLITLEEIRAELGALGLALRGEQAPAWFRLDPQSFVALASEWASKPLSEGDWDEHEKTLFVNLGLVTFSDLIRKSADELQKVDRFGYQSLIQMRYDLAQRGLYLKGEAPKGAQDLMTRLGGGLSKAAGGAESILPSIKQAKDDLSRPLEELKWSPRTQAIFEAAGLQTVMDLTRLSAGEFLLLKNSGQLPLMEVRDRLTALGLSLAGDDGSHSAEELEEDLKMTVFEANFSVRATNVLDIASIQTLADLIQWDAERLLEVRNLGESVLDEIRQKLAGRGLYLKGEASQKREVIKKPQLSESNLSPLSNQITLVWTPPNEKPRVIAVLGNDFYPGNIEGQWTIDWDQIATDRLLGQHEETPVLKSDVLTEWDDFLRQRGFAGSESPRTFGLKLRASIFSDNDLKGSTVAVMLSHAFESSEESSAAREQMMRGVAALTPRYYHKVATSGRFVTADFLNELDREFEVYQLTANKLSKYPSAQAVNDPVYILPSLRRLPQGVNVSRIAAVLSRLSRGGESSFVNQYSGELIAEFLDAHSEIASDWAIEYTEAAADTLLEKSVWTLDWDSQTRSNRAIMGLGVETIGELIGKTPQDVVGIPRVGHTALNEIRRVLEEKRLSLDQDPLYKKRFIQERVEDLFPALLSNKLLRKGILTLRDLLNTTGESLLTRYDLNSTDLVEVRRILRGRGFDLRTSSSALVSAPAWPQVKITALFSDGKRRVVARLGNGFTSDNLEGEWRYEEAFLSEAKTLRPNFESEPLRQNWAADRLEKILHEFKLTGLEDHRTLAFQLRARVLTADVDTETLERLNGALKFIWEHPSEVAEKTSDLAKYVVAALAPDFYATLSGHGEFDGDAFAAELKKEQAVLQYSSLAYPAYSINGVPRVAASPKNEQGRPLIDTARTAAILSRIGSGVNLYDTPSAQRRLFEELALRNEEFSDFREMKVEFEPLALNSILQQSVWSRPWHAYARRVIVKLGVETFGELIQISPDEILDLPKIGVTALNYIREGLAKVDLYLRGDGPTPAAVSTEHLFMSSWSIEEVLKQAGILSLKDLQTKSAKDLLAIPGFQEEYLVTVRKVISDQGYALRGEKPEPFQRPEWPQVKITAPFPDGERRVVAKLGNGFTPENLEGHWMVDEDLLKQSSLRLTGLPTGTKITPGFGLTVFPKGQFVKVEQLDHQADAGSEVVIEREKFDHGALILMARYDDTRGDLLVHDPFMRHIIYSVNLINYGGRWGFARRNSSEKTRIAFDFSKPGRYEVPSFNNGRVRVFTVTDGKVTIAEIKTDENQRRLRKSGIYRADFHPDSAPMLQPGVLEIEKQLRKSPEVVIRPEDWEHGMLMVHAYGVFGDNLILIPDQNEPSLIHVFAGRYDFIKRSFYPAEEAVQNAVRHTFDLRKPGFEERTFYLGGQVEARFEVSKGRELSVKARHSSETIELDVVGYAKTTETEMAGLERPPAWLFEPVEAGENGRQFEVDPDQLDQGALLLYDPIGGSAWLFIRKNEEFFGDRINIYHLDHNPKSGFFELIKEQPQQSLILDMSVKSLTNNLISYLGNTQQAKVKADISSQGNLRIEIDGSPSTLKLSSVREHIIAGKRPFLEQRPAQDETALPVSGLAAAIEQHSILKEYYEPSIGGKLGAVKQIAFIPEFNPEEVVVISFEPGDGGIRQASVRVTTRLHWESTPNVYLANPKLPHDARSLGNEVGRVSMKFDGGHLTKFNVSMDGLSQKRSQRKYKSLITSFFNPRQGEKLDSGNAALIDLRLWPDLSYDLPQGTDSRLPRLTQFEPGALVTSQEPHQLHLTIPKEIVERGALIQIEERGLEQPFMYLESDTEGRVYVYDVTAAGIGTKPSLILRPHWQDYIYYRRGGLRIMPNGSVRWKASTDEVGLPRKAVLINAPQSKVPLAIQRTYQKKSLASDLAKASGQGVYLRLESEEVPRSYGLWVSTGFKAPELSQGILIAPNPEDSKEILVLRMTENGMPDSSKVLMRLYEGGGDGQIEKLIIRPRKNGEVWLSSHNWKPVTEDYAIDAAVAADENETSVQGSEPAPSEAESSALQKAIAEHPVLKKFYETDARGLPGQARLIAFAPVVEGKKNTREVLVLMMFNPAEIGEQEAHVFKFKREDWEKEKNKTWEDLWAYAQISYKRVGRVDLLFNQDGTLIPSSDWFKGRKVINGHQKYRETINFFLQTLARQKLDANNPNLLDLALWPEAVWLTSIRDDEKDLYAERLPSTPQVSAGSRITEAPYRNNKKRTLFINQKNLEHGFLIQARPRQGDGDQSSRPWRPAYYLEAKPGGTIGVYEVDSQGSVRDKPAILFSRTAAEAMLFEGRWLRSLKNGGLSWNPSFAETDQEIAAFSAVKAGEADFSQLKGGYEFKPMNHFENQSMGPGEPWTWIQHTYWPSKQGEGFRVTGFLEPELKDGLLLVKNPYLNEEILAFRLTPEGTPLPEQVWGRIYPGGENLDFQLFDIMAQSDKVVFRSFRDQDKPWQTRAWDDRFVIERAQLKRSEIRREVKSLKLEVGSKKRDEGLRTSNYELQTRELNDLLFRSSATASSAQAALAFVNTRNLGRSELSSTERAVAAAAGTIYGSRSTIHYSQPQDILESYGRLIRELVEDAGADEVKMTKLRDIVRRYLGETAKALEGSADTNYQYLDLVDVTELNEDTAYALAILSIVRPRGDEIQVYVSGEDAKVREQIQAVTHGYERILSQLGARGRANLQMINVAGWDNGAIQKDMLAFATGENGKLQAAILSARVDFLNGIQVTKNTRRMNRARVGRAQALLASPALLAAQALDEHTYDVLKMRDELERLGLGVLLSEHFAQMIAAIKLLASAA